MAWAARSVVAAAVLVATVVAIDIHPAYADRPTKGDTATISAQRITRDGRAEAADTETVITVKPAGTIAFASSDTTALVGLASLLALTGTALLISRRRTRPTSDR